MRLSTYQHAAYAARLAAEQPADRPLTRENRDLIDAVTDTVWHDIRSRLLLSGMGSEQSATVASGATGALRARLAGLLG